MSWLDDLLSLSHKQNDRQLQSLFGPLMKDKIRSYVDIVHQADIVCISFHKWSSLCSIL